MFFSKNCGLNRALLQNLLCYIIWLPSALVGKIKQSKSCVPVGYPVQTRWVYLACYGRYSAILISFLVNNAYRCIEMFSKNVILFIVVFFLILRLLTKHILQLQNLKLKKKYITILQIGSKLQRRERIIQQL